MPVVVTDVVVLCAKTSPMYYTSRNSLHNYAQVICHHGGEHISEPKLPE